MLHKCLTLTMQLGEPVLVFWRVGDLLEALRASREMGLPLTSPASVADEVTARLLRALEDPENLP